MIKNIEVKNIKPNPFNARSTYIDKSIKELAEEIKESGFWAGALRGRVVNGKVELCFGHRRFEALKKLGRKEVPVEIVDLSDEDMAAQGLAENLQRVGLNDADKAEGIKRLVGMLAKKHGDKTPAYEEIQKMLGYETLGAVKNLVEVADYPPKVKAAIRQGKIKAATARKALNFGGDKMVETAIEKDLSQHTMERLSQALDAIPDEKIRTRLKTKVIAGEIIDPKEIQKKGESAVRVKKEKEEPPDMMVIIAMWTDHINTWIKAIDEMTPYKHLMNEAPVIAREFRQAAKKLIAKLEKLIAENARIERTVN